MPDEDLDKDGAQGGAADSTDSGGTDQGGSNSNEGTDNASEGTGSAGSTEEQVSKAEYDKILERMRAADRRSAATEAELKKIRDKDLPEAEKLQREHQEAVQRAEKAESDLRQARISNAFLEDNTYKWKNPKTALKLVDLGQVEIAEDGSVTGLKEALKALAQSEPYLLDTAGKEDTGNGGGGGSGAPPMNGKGGGSKPDSKKLQSRLPAMRTRVTNN